MQITSFRQKSWFSSETRNLLAKSQTPNEGSSQRIGNSTQISYFESKILNYKIRKLAKIDRHEEFVAADF